jgi:hypothetical protein
MGYEQSSYAVVQEQRMNAIGIVCQDISSLKPHKHCQGSLVMADQLNLYFLVVLKVVYYTKDW